jgi:hypothetical protein
MDRELEASAVGSAVGDNFMPGRSEGDIVGFLEIVGAGVWIRINKASPITFKPNSCISIVTLAKMGEFIELREA